MLGTSKHLIVDDGKFFFAHEVPKNVLHLTGDIKQLNDNCLDSLLKLSGFEIVTTPPEKYVKMMQTLSPELSSPPWAKIMPFEAHKSFAQSLVDTVNGCLPKASLGYFRDTWVHGNSLLRKLQFAKIDVSAVHSFIVANDGNLAALRSFLVEKIPEYDRFGTRTGRMTISSGPDILTLKREQRSVLKSSFGDEGKILNIDFSAIEIRALLYEAGDTCAFEDLYEDFATRIFYGKYSRKVIKAAVICAIYGASKSELSRKLNISPVDLVKLTERFKTHFKVSELKSRLRKEYFSTKHIKNFYGRNLKIDNPSDHILLNSYGQSTGADVAMIGFDKLTNKIDLDACRPLFVLHDALIVDVHNDYIDELKKNKWINIDGYSQQFSLAIT